MEGYRQNRKKEGKRKMEPLIQDPREGGQEPREGGLAGALGAARQVIGH